MKTLKITKALLISGCLLPLLSACDREAAKGSLTIASSGNDKVRLIETRGTIGSTLQSRYFLSVPLETGTGYFRLDCAVEGVRKLGEEMGLSSLSEELNFTKIETEARVNPTLTCKSFEGARPADLIFSRDGWDEGERNGYYINFAAKPEFYYMIGCQAIANYLGSDLSHALPGNSVIDRFYKKKAIRDIPCFNGEKPGPLLWEDWNNRSGNRTVDVTPGQALHFVDLSAMEGGSALDIIGLPAETDNNCSWIKAIRKDNGFELSGTAPDAFKEPCRFTVQLKTKLNRHTTPLTLSVQPQKNIRDVFLYAFSDQYAATNRPIKTVQLPIPPLFSRQLKDISLVDSRTRSENDRRCNFLQKPFSRGTASIDGQDLWEFNGLVPVDATDAVCDMKVIGSNFEGDKRELGSIKFFISTQDDATLALSMQQSLQKSDTICLGDKACYANIAGSAQTAQSSFDPMLPYGASLANDNSLQTTTLTDINFEPWWEMNFPGPQTDVKALSILSKPGTLCTDPVTTKPMDCLRFLNGAVIDFFGSDGEHLARRTLHEPQAAHVLAFDKGFSFQKIRISKLNEWSILSLAEVQIWKKAEPLTVTVPWSDKLDQNLFQGDLIQEIHLNIAGLGNHVAQALFMPSQTTVCKFEEASSGSAFQGELHVRVEGSVAIISSTKPLPAGQTPYKVCIFSPDRRVTTLKAGTIRVKRTLVIAIGSDFLPKEDGNFTSKTESFRDMGRVPVGISYFADAESEALHHKAYLFGFVYRDDDNRLSSTLPRTWDGPQKAYTLQERVCANSALAGVTVYTDFSARFGARGIRWFSPICLGEFDSKNALEFDHDNERVSQEVVHCPPDMYIGAFERKYVPTGFGEFLQDTAQLKLTCVAFDW